MKFVWVLLVLSVCALNLPECLAITDAKGKRVLVLGGTQFMGRWTVERLLAEGYAVTVLNRGVSPNPWPADRVGRLVADRMEDIEDRPEGTLRKFRKVLGNSGEWDLVVDFTGFEEEFMEDTVESLRKEGGGFSVRHYIYISTDSVYWALKLPDDDSRINESAPQQFAESEMEKHEKYLDQTATGEYQKEYGGNKLSCDTYLAKAFKEEGFPYTSLRLPDVYGPHDNLGSFWEIAEKVKNSKKVGGKLSPGRIRPRGNREAIADNSKHRVTWVYVADVVDAIIAAVEAGHTDGKTPPFGEVYNIAHGEAVNLEELCSMMLRAGQRSTKLSGLFSGKGAEVDYSLEADVPSTDFGALDIGKVQRHLKWQPRPMEQTVQRALEWYYGDRNGYPTSLAQSEEL